MSTFVNSSDSMYSMLNKRFGENGTTEHITTQSTCLDLFFQGVRNANSERIENYIENIISTGDKNNIIDLFVILFQTRDCRGGKGERELFYTMFIKLYKIYPAIIIDLLDVISTFGYFKDFWNILHKINNNKELSNIPNINKLIDRILSLYALQLKHDLYVCTSKEKQENISITLAGKFAPREKHSFAVKNKRIFNKFVYEYMYPNSNTSKMEYRKHISILNSASNVTEVLMCDKKYSEINFKNVPSLCTKRFRKAFLNEKVRGEMLVTDNETGNRFPNDLDRVECRKNFLNSIKSGKINGKQLMPHEIVRTFFSLCNFRSNTISNSEIELLETQWEKIKESILPPRDDNNENTLNLGKLIPLVDVSSSMSGTPMEVAVALGILVSELTHPDFRNRIITFETNPSWINLENIDKLREKVITMKRSPWGGSTDFNKAMDLIINVVKKNNIPPEEIPDLIVFSDMQFNLASPKFETQYEVLKQKFADLGVTLRGKPYNVPRIIFWNLRSTDGFPVSRNEINTVMLSGFSPSMLKHILNGEKVSNTPEEVMRSALDDTRYDIVRNIVKCHFKNNLLANL